jgi:hypothetical protein
MPARSRARELAARFNASGDPCGWFEPLYREAEEGRSEVPWADLRPNPHLLSLWSTQPWEASGKTALVVGSGLGDDAEQLARWGFRTTAFDIAETAIAVARRRFPASAVEYVTADLFAPPPSWLASFDFVLEAYTLQVFPAEIRRKVIEKISRFVRAPQQTQPGSPASAVVELAGVEDRRLPGTPGGLLLAIARGREPNDPEGQMPWPLTRAEVDEFTRFGLEQRRFDDYVDPNEPGVRRFRALYQRTRLASD